MNDTTAHTLSNLGGVDVTSSTVVSAASVAVDAATAGGAVNLLVFTSTSATSFASAIGSGSISITGLSSTEVVAATFYDSANSQAVFGYILNSNTSLSDVLNSSDSFIEMLRISMSSSDYTFANIGSSFTFF